MEIPHNYLENLSSKAVASKIRNYRDEQIMIALEEINRARIGTKYRPLKFMAIKLKVEHLSDSDLGYFISVCQKAKCGFSKCFFGALKVKWKLSTVFSSVMYIILEMSTLNM